MAVDDLVIGVVFAVVVALGKGEVVRTVVTPVLEDVFAQLAAAAHPETVDADSIAIRPAQSTKDVGILDSVAVVGVGAVVAVVADGNVRIGGRRVQRRLSFPSNTSASIIALLSLDGASHWSGDFVPTSRTAQEYRQREQSQVGQQWAKV